MVLRLLEDVFLAGAAEVRPEDVGPLAMDDGAAMWIGDRWVVLTTDSHVVHPIFFPGGDIGRLSICGTVNDLAMMGATEVLGLTCGAILEEGRTELASKVPVIVYVSPDGARAASAGSTSAPGSSSRAGLSSTTGSSPGGSRSKTG